MQRRLTCLAYPTAPSEVRETLGKDAFIDALVNSDMRLRIKQSRPENLNDAIRLAVELDAYFKTERRGDLRMIDNVSSAQSAQMTELVELMRKMQSKLDTLEKEVHDRSYNQDLAMQASNRSRNSGVVCYYCKKRGHIRRNCPSLKNKEDQKPAQKSSEGSTQRIRSNRRKNKRMRGNVGASTMNNEAGIYVQAMINGSKSKMLIDTGASLTLISKKVYDLINHNSRPKLQESAQKVFNASGGILTQYGKAEFCISIGNSETLISAIVTDITVDGILGLDFLKKGNGVINLQTNTLQLNGENCAVSCEGSLGCYRVTAANDIHIPPRSEMVIEAKILGQHTFGKADYIIEPDDKFLERGRAMVGRTLVKGRETVPVRLMNITEEVQPIYKGTTIAKMTAADEENLPQTFQEHTAGELRPDLRELLERSKRNLSHSQVLEVENFLRRHQNLFASSNFDLGRTAVVKHKINTGPNEKPIKQGVRRIPLHLSQEVDKQVNEMLEKDVIEPSNSPWASPVVLVRKKDGTMRFCIDYRRLNEVTVKDAYPLPNIDEAFDHLSGHAMFSTLDLNSGYWQVAIEEKDKPKTAFVTRRGLFQFKVMPFGLTCAPATFERLMETVLAGLQWDKCLVYLDDIIVIGNSFENMLENLEKVFDRLQRAGLKLKAKKCNLFATKVSYLGHIISCEGIATDPEKIKAVAEWPIPTNVTEVRSFLGMCSYYRRFIRDFASEAKPLHCLTEKGRKFLWTKEAQIAFETLRNRLITAPILALPDITKRFILDTDASNNAIGAVLSQEIDGRERVIAYASRTLTKAERKYCVTRKELLAVVNFIKHFRHYLYGKEFLIRTDHGSLKWLLRFKNPEGQLARWLEVISTYNMKIEHRPGRKHGNADGLSRIPCCQCGFDPDWEKTASKPLVMSLQTVANDDKFDGAEESTTLQEAQKQSRDTQLVRKWIEKGSRPVFSDISHHGYVIKSLWNQFERLAIEDGLLVRRWVLLPSNREVFQAIIPDSERRRVLEMCHDNKTSGHLGVTKTLAKIRQRYYWPGLQRDVHQYVAGCETCTKRKNPIPRRRAPMKIAQSGAPMERIATDILCELPETERGNRHILVVSDYFTKWTEAFALPDMEAETIARTIMEHVVVRFGVPAVIHSDQGRQYESKLFTEMCKLLGITKTRTTPYHPKSDGMVERFNRTLLSMMSAFVQENQRDWDVCLPYVLMAYRSTVHETTGFSPNMLMLGRESTTPLDLMYEMPPEIKSIPANQWVWALRERLEKSHAIVRENVQGEMLRQKKYHDAKTSWSSFEPGEMAYVYFPVRKSGCSHKLTSFWRGPYEVEKKLSDVLYKVACGFKGKSTVIHCDRMRKYHAQTLRGEDNSSATSEERHEFDADEEQSHADENVADHAHWTAIEEHGASESNRPKRARTRPAWLQDYEIDYSA